METCAPLLLAPEFRERVWGGCRLSHGEARIGEMWLAHNNSRILNGQFAGLTLGEITRAAAPSFFGSRLFHPDSAGFPLLVKILDTSDWLSVQVHPDEALARRLEGENAHGKTEAWHVLDAAPGARVIVGLQPATCAESLREAAGNARLLDLLHFESFRTGDTMLVPAGTVHALGPGYLIYEIQQMSDVTYRLYDWCRPQAVGRELHLDRGLAAIEIGATPQLRSRSSPEADSCQTLTSCAWFALQRVRAVRRPAWMSGAGKSFHLITAAAGEIALRGLHWRLTLTSHQTAFVPASVAEYTIRTAVGASALVASLP